MTNKKEFTDIGQLVATRDVVDKTEEDPQYHEWIQACLQRYFRCDWGDLCEEDKTMNDESISGEGEEAGRVLARYNNPKGDIYIITEWDRSVTTILHLQKYKDPTQCIIRLLLYIILIHLCIMLKVNIKDKCSFRMILNNV